MSDFPIRRVQSAKVNLCKLYPNACGQHQSSNNNLNGSESNIIDLDQHSLNEQRQKISQQILMTRSQVVPLRQKAAELSEKMKFLHPNLLFEIEEPETPESIFFSRLSAEKKELEESLRHLEDLSSPETESKFKNDISRYRNNLETVKELTKRGSEILREKRDSFDVIIHSEIYSRVIEQRNRIEELQKKMNELLEESRNINENTSTRINEFPEIRKLNQKVMFLQKRLSSLKHEKNFKADELIRMRNTKTPRRSPRAKSRRKMNSGIELKKRKQQQLQKQQNQSSTGDSISQLPLLSKNNILSHSMRSKDFSNMFLQPSSGLKKSNSNSDIKGFDFNDNSDNSDGENYNENIRENYFSNFNNIDDEFINKIEKHEANRNFNDEKSDNATFDKKRETVRNFKDENSAVDDVFDNKSKDEIDNQKNKNRLNLKISTESFGMTINNSEIFDVGNDDSQNSDKCQSPISLPNINVKSNQEKSPRVVRFGFDYERQQNQ